MNFCSISRMEFLYQDYKEPVVLTDDEKSLCKMLCGGWIARDRDGILRWHKSKPYKQTEKICWWGKDKYNAVSMAILTYFPQCKFDFIKWEDDEPWEVQVND